jgi:hypothetical protein
MRLKIPKETELITLSSTLRMVENITVLQMPTAPK